MALPRVRLPLMADSPARDAFMPLVSFTWFISQAHNRNCRIRTATMCVVLPLVAAALCSIKRVKEGIISKQGGGFKLAGICASRSTLACLAHFQRLLAMRFQPRNRKRRVRGGAPFVCASRYQPAALQTHNTLWSKKIHCGQTKEKRKSAICKCTSPHAHLPTTRSKTGTNLQPQTAVTLCCCC